MKLCRKLSLRNGWSRHIVLAVLLGHFGAFPIHAQDNRLSRLMPGDSLSTSQTEALALLEQARPDHPASIFLFSDPNKDPDDLCVLVQTKHLHDHGFISLKTVVTTLGDRNRRRIRARFARCVLDDLGLNDVKVGVGEDYDIEVRDAVGTLDAKATAGRRNDHDVFIETPLLRPQALVEMDGLALLVRELQRVSDRSAVLLINSGMVDVAQLFRSQPQLVKQKVGKVVIMGGVTGRVDERGFVTADKRAYNNNTDQASADFVYTQAQEHQLPLVVVVKEAAYAAASTRSFYDGMAATGHPIGIFLRDQQRQSLAHLWKGIHLGHLPPALTPQWFFETFTDVDPKSPSGAATIEAAAARSDEFEAVWQQVCKFNLYDPLALLAATPGVNELVFQGEVPQGASRDIQVIGRRSVKDPELARNLMAALAVASLTASSEKSP